MAIFYISYFANTLVVDLKQSVQQSLINRLSNSTFNFYASLQSGWLNNIIMKETSLFTQGFMELARIQTTLFFMIVYFFTASILQFDVVLILIIFVCVLIFPMKKFMHLVRHVSIDWTDKSGRVSSSFNEFFENFIYTKATARTLEIVKNLRMKIMDMNIAEKRMLKYSSLIRALSEPIAITALAILIYKHVVIEKLPLSEVLVIALVVFRSIAQLMNLQGQYQRFNSAFGSIEIVKSTLNDLKKHAEENGKTKINRINDIEFIDVSTSYGSKTIIKNFDLKISAKKMIGIIGSSGSGKTTIFYTLWVFLFLKKVNY